MEFAATFLKYDIQGGQYYMTGGLGRSLGTGNRHLSHLLGTNSGGSLLPCNASPRCTVLSCDYTCLLRVQCYSSLYQPMSLMSSWRCHVCSTLIPAVLSTVITMDFINYMIPIFGVGISDVTLIL